MVESFVARYRVVVHGTVQGVWFRDSCRRAAIEEDVTGWVRNRPDGTVEAVFEGPLDAVARCVSWCRMGPPRAEVTGIDVTEEPAEGICGFTVR
ncbi:MAG: acylphosphatase [Actinomycetota bacterium]|nr:acylphosphatase [Actinomycetota bacterium]